MASFTRIGKCNDCGACCYLYSHLLGRFHWCPYYSFTKKQHCLIHSHPKRNQECKEFPLYPMDLERVGDKCSFQFVDDKGVVIDPYMDKNVRLTPVKKGALNVR